MIVSLIIIQNYSRINTKQISETRSYDEINRFDGCFITFQRCDSKLNFKQMAVVSVVILALVCGKQKIDNTQ